MREFQRVFDAAEMLEDAKPPGAKPAAASGSAVQPLSAPPRATV